VWLGLSHAVGGVAQVVRLSHPLGGVRRCHEVCDTWDGVRRPGRCVTGSRGGRARIVLSHRAYGCRTCWAACAGVAGCAVAGTGCAGRDGV